MVKREKGLKKELEEANLFLNRIKEEKIKMEKKLNDELTKSILKTNELDK